MIRSLILALLTAATSALVTGRLQAEQPTPEANKTTSVNAYCPVMPDSLASADWSTVYRGQQVNFCCNNCVDSFRANPKGYLDRLPHIPNDGVASVPFADYVRKTWISSVEWLRSPHGRVVFVFIVATLTFGIWRSLQQRRAKRNQEPLSVRPVMAEMLIFGLLATVVHLAWNNSHLESEVIKQRVLRVVHHSTYYDHGYPPEPPRPKANKRLSARFYRGNDERSEFLYNGGNYQTATFDVCIQRQDGRPVLPGESIDGEQLYVSYSIKRPEKSPDRLYGSKIMDRIYLTQEYGELMGYEKPIRDYLPLKRLDSHHWHARYPLGVVSAHTTNQLNPTTATRKELLQVKGVTEEYADWFLAYREAGFPIRGREDLRHAGIEGAGEEALAAAFGKVACEGNVYVCEANLGPDGRQMGARFHYGIGYKLFIENGKVLPESDIWMGALSRSQKAAKGKIPADQWLSERPLPLVPERQELSDSLLGIDDWD